MKQFLKKFLVLVLSAAGFLTSTISFADGIPITLLSNANGTYSLPIDKIVDIVKKNIVSLSPSDYYKAKVQVIYDEQQKPDYLLVYLLSAKNYSYTVTKIKINEEYQPSSVISNYQLQKKDIQEQPSTKLNPALACPDEATEFVSATPVDDIRTAKEAIDYTYEKALAHGYKVHKMLGNEASVENYQNWLTCPNLKGFFNVGHGSNTAIMLSDGILSNEFFNNELKDKLHKRTVILFNSCNVHNDPLKGSVTESAEAQKYAGGITSLLIGPSEQASKCFWDAAFSQQSLTSSLSDCNHKYDPRDVFGIEGHGLDLFDRT